MKKTLIAMALSGLLFSFGCAENQKKALVVAEESAISADTIAPVNVMRFGSVTGLKPEKVSYYKELHAAAWPDVLKKIEECNIRNYSIYLKEIEGKPYLFSYFEYTGNDFDADMKKMAADPTTRRWWKETDPCQSPLPDAAAKGEIWSGMEEVFHTN